MILLATLITAAAGLVIFALGARQLLGLIFRRA